MSKVEQKHGQIKTLVQKILEYGDVLLISQKGFGKTNSLMVLSKAFMEMENCRVFVFEDFPKFAVEFDTRFVKVLDSDVVETKDTVQISDYYLSHKKDLTVLRGSFYKQALENNRHLTFTIEIKDIERKAFFIYSIVQKFYRQAYLRAYKNRKQQPIIFVIEESQNAFAQATLNRKIFNRLHSIFNVARNLDLHFVLASQRFTDLNPKIRNRTQLLIGNTHRDDYELRIGRLLRHSKHREKVLEFAKGEFLFTTTDTIIKFPLFKTTNKSIEWKPKPIECASQKPKKEHRTLKAIGKLFGNLLFELPKPRRTTTKENEKDKQERDEQDEFQETFDEDFLGEY